MEISRLHVDKLNVGGDDVSWIPPDKSPNGTAILNGPVMVGKPTASPNATAVMNIGPSECKQAPYNLQPELNVPLSMQVDGNTVMLGNGLTANALYVTGGGSVDSLYVDGDVFVTGKVDCGNKGKLASRFATADAKGKVFDMTHPVKGKGYRLAHACIEGPEIGVYFRGRCKNEEVIKIPDYWKGLVHTDSISVQLQPVGAHQDIIVKRWDDDFIYLQANGVLPINCFYHVYGERKDINPLYVEYEGDDCFDYPDPNHTKSIDDPTRNLSDPQYTGKRNTYTI